ncbi:MAG: S1-C subfamily serine protease [Bradymonadia bacterium]
MRFESPEFAIEPVLIQSSGGLVVTNMHVIADATDLRISLANGSEYEAEVLGIDEGIDLALLQIVEEEEFDFPTLQLSETPRARERPSSRSGARSASRTL